MSGRLSSPLASLRRLLRPARHADPTRAIAHLDSPVGPIASNAVINGWLALDATAPIERLWLTGGNGTAIPLAVTARRDVEKAMPGKTTSGFTGWLDVRTIGGGPWYLNFVAGPASGEVALPLAAQPGAAAAFDAAKRAKLALVRNLVRCPACKTELSNNGGKLRCSNGHRFTAHADAFDFLDDDTRASVGAVATDNVSTHGYDPVLTDLITRSTGPILDVGSGLRPVYRDDVINVEIALYPTTDVVAASEHLPFADNAFDLVISVAVLEHVRDPFAAARELERVLRPGGRLFVAAPFLVPYHAYPNHYYNMTSNGLRNLFPSIDVERLEVPASGLPIFALSWMLDVWRRNLPPTTAAQFEEMRVGDLARDPAMLSAEPFVTELSSDGNLELAALNILIGRKPGPSD